MPEQTPNGPDSGDSVSRAGHPGAEPAGAHASERSATTLQAPPSERSSRGAMSLFLPALTFLLGLALGAVVMWASVGADDEDDGVAGPAPTTTEEPVTPTVGTPTRPDVTVTVPGACLEVADRAEELAALVQEAATAAQELDAAELSSIVRELQESQSGLESQSSACRTDAG